jgi:hypothetical protein
MLHIRTLASSDPLMKYLSSTGLNWMQVTVQTNAEKSYQKQMKRDEKKK